MTSTLQDAIGAVRQGNVEQAQRQLAEVISANPDDVQAWYLLSQIVDSDARRAAYLSKTLTLDPFHERAWAEFFSLPIDVVSRLEPGQAPLPVVGSEIAAEAPLPITPAVAVAATGVVTTGVATIGVTTSGTVPAVDVETALPDWLRPVAKDQPIVAQKREAPAPKQVDGPQPLSSPTQPDAPVQENKTLSVLLAILVIATVLVLAFLVYLLLQN